MADAPKPDEVEELMKMLGVTPTKGGSPTPAVAARAGRPGAPSTVEFEPLEPAAGARPEQGLELLRDVNVQVRVELGRSRMCIQDILKLGPGSVVPLESLTGDPLDIYVNDRLVAHGEVLVINENFAVRVTEVVSPQKAQER